MRSRSLRSVAPLSQDACRWKAAFSRTIMRASARAGTKRMDPESVVGHTGWRMEGPRILRIFLMLVFAVKFAMRHPIEDVVAGYSRMTRSNLSKYVQLLPAYLRNPWRPWRLGGSSSAFIRDPRSTIHNPLLLPIGEYPSSFRLGRFLDDQPVDFLGQLVI